MRILKVKIGKSFKSISGVRLQFHNRFSILAGRNNVGKTALLEAIGNVCKCTILDKIPDFPNISNKEYLLTLDIELDESDKVLLFGKSIEPDNCPKYLNLGLDIDENIIYFDSYFCAFSSEDFLNEKYELLVPFLKQLYKRKDRTNEDEYEDEFDELMSEIQKLFLTWFRESIIYISVHRQISSPSSIIPNLNLDYNASNLYTVLYTLRNNEGEIFDKIQQQFLLMFPDVRRINTVVDYYQETQENFTRVTLDFENQNNIPLDECGSGYTQVLIMLCLIYSKKERVILFDEPHTFLHPHAEKSIYDLAVGCDRHQYIFSTHSPLLINYPVEKRIFFVKKINNVSNYIEMDSIQEILEDLGISNSDFSFADRVIFVEGPTEEKILPLIFKKNGFRQVGFNYKIISLNGTDRDFMKRSAMVNNSEKLESIFNAISHSPIPYRILLDRDEKTQDKIIELETNYQGKIVVLPRREIENYFLIEEAICALIKNHTPEEEVKLDNIKEYIKNCLADKQNKNFYPRGCNTPLDDIKASKVLEEILSKYSIKYNKIIDGLFIVEWLYQNGYHVLDEIYNFFADFLQGKN
ncbi:AAA family ATPase [Peribacillus sp. FSL K6-1552]|uniref:ATP-dependent nuclease n=1 Tax=Peribacillus sp. FSL K6-1552 TaxID=2954514 RepID=UPI0030F581DE